MKAWYCGWKQATAAPQDWLEAQVDWHTGNPAMIERKMEDVLPWCPLCRMDGGLNLKPDDSRRCGWVELVPVR